MAEANARSERKANWVHACYDKVGTPAKDTGIPQRPVFFLFSTNREATEVLKNGIVQSGFEDIVEQFHERTEEFKCNFVYAVPFDVGAKLEIPKLVDQACPDKMPYATAYLFLGNGRDFMATSKNPALASEVAFFDAIPPDQIVKLSRGKGRNLTVDQNEENKKKFDEFVNMNTNSATNSTASSGSASTASAQPTGTSASPANMESVSAVMPG